MRLEYHFWKKLHYLLKFVTRFLRKLHGFLHRTMKHLISIWRTDVQRISKKTKKEFKSSHSIKAYLPSIPFFKNGSIPYFLCTNTPATSMVPAFRKKPSVHYNRKHAVKITLTVCGLTAWLCGQLAHLCLLANTTLVLYVSVCLYVCFFFTHKITAKSNPRSV